MKTLAIALLAFAATRAANLPLIKPADLAARLKAKGAHPTLIHVGFHVLYRNRHIPETIYAGPANTPAGLANLKAAAGKLARNGEIVIYCGCCPWDHCPNIQPAVQTLRQMGFTNVKALYIPTNMAADWFERGYPAEPIR